MIKKLTIISLAVCGFVTAAVFTKKTEHPEFGPSDFCHPSILKRESSNPDLASKQFASEILKQQFSYLGCGGQVTAYESADHKYVLKFFNPRRSLFNKRKLLERHFMRYTMSLKDLKEETGVIYNHFDPSTVLQQTVEVIGKEGRLHSIPLEAYPFVLQKKVELALPYLENLVKEGKIEEAKEATRQLYALFASRAQKGYRDHMQNLTNNFGFFEGKAIQLDPGRIRKDAAIAQNPHREIARVIANIKPYLSNYPVLTDVLDECLTNPLTH
jgi:hypothetical protein